MKKLLIVLLCVLAWTTAAENIGAQETETTLHMMYTTDAGYRVRDLDMLTDLFRELSGIRVNIDYVPYKEQYEKISELGATYDVLSLDQIWMADFAEQGVLLPLDSYFSRKIRDDMLPSVFNAFRYRKQIWAFPFLANYQLFFYNKAMLDKAKFTAPPATLEEMLDQMIELKKLGIVKYPWTDAWRSGENLICEYTWLTAAFGGSLFDAEGTPMFAQGAGLKALEFMVTLLQKELAAPKILLNDDLAAKDDFMNGTAAFTTNWVFLEGLLRQTAQTLPATTAAATQTPSFLGKAALIPVGKSIAAKSASVSGFQGLAMSASSGNREAAWKWISFLTSPVAQRAFLSEMPLWNSVQTAAETKYFDPLMTLKRTQLENVSHRPKLVDYAEISQILQRYLSKALTEELFPDEALMQAKTEIEAVMKASKDEEK